MGKMIGRRLFDLTNDLAGRRDRPGRCEVLLGLGETPIGSSA
ncbi:hypothetical protein AB0K18_45655 [Nonomuraea sp. NPDC049421]